MPDVVCSLKTPEGWTQTIPPGSTYTLVRFPFGGESYDPLDMHPIVQPDTGQAAADVSPRAGLVWPAHDAWAYLHAMVQWEDGDYSEVRDQFCRDPLGVFGVPDSTCTEDHGATPGGQFRAKSWAMFVYRGVPLGLRVRHNASVVGVKLTLAEIKISYRICTCEAL